jgi:hypothetical protein
MDRSFVLIIPHRPLNPEKVKNALAIYKNHHELTAERALIANDVLVLTIPRSRFLWHVLAPFFLCADRGRARCAAMCLLKHFEPGRVSLPSCPKSAAQKDFPRAPWAQKRSLRNRRNDHSTQHFLWLEPSSHVQHDDSFTGRLIAWEHKLIRAQSLTGYIATLGGGFFLCHHFQTAIALAQQQQQLALFLNDYGMYYRCMVNTAYNFVYAGKFRMAHQVIQYVWTQAKLLTPADPVLEKMCSSAMLFCNRVRKASNRLRASRVSTTIDDFARIRVFDDQSHNNDLHKPFNGDFRHVNNYLIT